MRKYLPLFVYPPIVILLDQISKYWIVQHIPIGQARPVLPGLFDLVHFRNRGVAFSMLDDLSANGHEWFFHVVTIAAIAALFAIYSKTKEDERKMQVPLAIIFGGAIGNFIDRLTRGEVVDFLYFHWYHRIAEFDLLGRHFRFYLAWPAFNVADTAITCGALYLVSRVLFGPKEKTAAG